MACCYANLLEQKNVFTQEKGSAIKGLVWYTNMAASYSFVTKQYGGRDAMLNEYEWHPTTGNKKPRNQEIYSKKITGLYHVMFNLEIRFPASCQT